MRFKQNTLLSKVLQYLRGSRNDLDRADGMSDENLEHIPRPMMRCALPLWENENILILSPNTSLFELAKELSACGAEVSFRYLQHLQDLYQLPLEQYTLVLMTSGISGQQFDVVDVGGILRRADPSLTLVWASDQFKLSMIADSLVDPFCDLQLALPTSASHLATLLAR